MGEREPIILTASQCKIATLIWDVDWLGEAEIQILIDKFPSGPFIYQAICCEIASRGGFLPKSLLRGLFNKTKTSIETIEAIVDYCATPDLGLLRVTPHGITSRRVQREIERFVKMKIQKKVKDAIIIFPWSDLRETVPSGGEIVPLGGENSPPSKERQGSGMDQERIRKGKEEIPIAPPPEPPLDPLLEYAESQLEPPHDQPWTRENSFINAGRRPMKRYPLLRLTAPSLAGIFKTIEEAGLPKSDRKLVFEAAEKQAKKMLEQGKSLDFAASEAWLTGFCLQNTLDISRKKIQLAQTQARNG